MNPLLHALFAILVLAGAAHAQVQRAIDIRTLPYERSLEKLPVDLTATVTFVESGTTAFAQDATAGTHLHFKPARNDLRAGDRVRVLGHSIPGLYLPGVQVDEITLLGHESAPPAVAATYDDLATGRFHYQRVVVEGLGRTLTPLDENRSLLRLAMGSRVIEVRVDATPETAPALIDARLRITALAAGGINDRRQLVFPYLRVTDWTDVTTREPPADPAALPAISVATLLQFGAADEPHHRVRIRGTVLAAMPDGRVFLRDSTPPPPPREPTSEPVIATPLSPSIAIQLATPAALTPGDQAEITGFPIMAGFSASLADALVLAAEPAEAPTPTNITTAALHDGSHDADLVRLTTPATLNDFFRTPDGHELRFTIAGRAVRAFLAGNEVPAIDTGSSCELTGICLIESSTDRGFRSQPERASLLLRSMQDVRVLNSAPFWSARRLVIAIASLGGVILLTLVRITLQRRQITRLQARIAHQAAQEERQRIAREFHDTLEQELAGLSLRLDAATTRPLEEKARTLLETSRSLVSRIQSEARNLVSDLRDTAHSTTLTEALESLATRTREHLDVALELQPLPAIAPHITHHLRMIAQEAVTNTLKHAQATRIAIRASSTPESLTLEITDNGRGFDASALSHGTPGHFGCVGIRERCRKIGAEAAWRSTPGTGTVLTVALPLKSSH